MAYFKAKKNNTFNIKIFLSVIAFVIIIILCVYGSDKISTQNTIIQQQTLEDALHKCTIQYYALEGFYPENLSELLKSCALSYDSNKFFIDYQPVASNVMPDITVILRK